MDAKRHTAEKSLAVVCAQTLKICRVPFWGGESAPFLKRDKDEKSRTTVDVQPFLYQNAAKGRKTTSKQICSHNVYNAQGLEESRRVCYDGKKHKGDQADEFCTEKGEGA